MEVEQDKVDVKEVFIVQIPLKFNMKIGRTCQHIHTGNQDHIMHGHGPWIYYIILRTVTNRETNSGYWHVAI